MPKLSDSRRFSGMAPQLIATKGFVGLGQLPRRMARARSSFPVPDSPVEGTVVENPKASAPLRTDLS